MVTLFSLDTSVCGFSIVTVAETFKISGVTFGFRYEVLAGDVFLFATDCVFKAARAIIEHRTGIREWDASTEQSPDMLRDWKCHIGDRFKMQLIADYFEYDPQSSYRALDDYLRHKHPYLMDRMDIIDLLDDMYFTGQLTALLSDHMAPAEYAGSIENWKGWVTRS